LSSDRDPEIDTSGEPSVFRLSDELYGGKLPTDSLDATVAAVVIHHDQLELMLGFVIWQRQAAQ
jgi:hypothetical protein